MPVPESVHSYERLSLSLSLARYGLSKQRVALITSSATTTTGEDAPIKRPFSKAYSMTSARVDTTDKIRCFAYTMEGGYCSRANTIKSYVQMNLDVPTAAPPILV